MDDTLVRMLTTQLQLQTDHQKDGDPRILDPETRAVFMTWNFAACVKELSEAMDEVGWKPWGTNRTVNHSPFLKEMLDAWCFFMNMLLAGSGIEDPEELASVMLEFYLEKNFVNAQRQIEGYDGMAEKCPTCKRDFAETDPTKAYMDQQGVKFCCELCALHTNDEEHTDGHPS